MEKIDSDNRQQTTQKLSGLLTWYREIADDELIAAWNKEPRVNLMDAMESLADTRVATEVIKSSWRDNRATAFRLDYAPMYGHLMLRFPESANPFLDDLLSASGPPDLPETQAEAVCRILVDMPDLRSWKRDALRILPHYRRAAENLLNQDVHGSDREKSFQAQVWLTNLNMDVPGDTGVSRRVDTIANEPRRERRRAVSPDFPASPPAETYNRAAAVNLPSATAPQPVQSAPAPQLTTTPAASQPSQSAVGTRPLPPQAPAPPSLYQGPRNGTVESVGGPIPQNAEYVFRSLPPGILQLDYDMKIWEARLVPGEGGSQRLIVKNKSNGPQKRCVVRWSLNP